MQILFYFSLNHPIFEVALRFPAGIVKLRCPSALAYVRLGPCTQML